jgi:uncharacterized protein YndB with AHSA1/START domain
MADATSHAGLSYERMIGSDIDVVWRALTAPDDRQQGYHEQLPESTWMPGEPLRFVDSDGTATIEGTIVDVDAPHRLVHTFSYTAAGNASAAASDAPSQVTWNFESDDDGTRVTLQHDGLDAQSATWRSAEDGWEQLLDGLTELFEPVSDED